ncbi:MAG TPA: hypothetical protein PKN62_01485 [bacterium]|nr:hypothetical protein [bacterium]
MTDTKKKDGGNFLPDQLEGDEVSLKKLHFGLWYMRNRRLFLTLVVAFLSIVAISGWAYSFYGLGRYFIFDQSEDQQSIMEMAQTGVNLLAGKNNQPLEISPVKILGSKKADFVAEINNPNNRTAVFFNYAFKANDQTIVQKEGFVLPGQRRYLVALDQEKVSGANIDLSISQTKWQKLNAREIPDWEKFLKERNNLVISEQQITLASTNNQPARIKFNINNRTAFGYWSVPVLLMAYQDDNLVGVNELILNKLKSGETRNVNFTWSELNRANRLEVTTSINYLDDNNYLPLD